MKEKKSYHKFQYCFLVDTHFTEVFIYSILVKCSDLKSRTILQSRTQKILTALEAIEDKINVHHLYRSPKQVLFSHKSL